MRIYLNASMIQSHLNVPYPKAAKKPTEPIKIIKTNDNGIIKRHQKIKKTNTRSQKKKPTPNPHISFSPNPTPSFRPR